MVGIHWLRSHGRVAVPVIVVATAVVTLLATVAHPDRIFFDETYYVNDARDFLEYGVEQGFVVHPPLGKLLIATSITVVGDTPLGWRLLGALLAVASVALVYDLARRLGMRVAAAGLAALALALDGVWIAQAHTAMLDIHLGFFVVLGAWALVRDRNHVRRADDEAVAAAARMAPTPDRGEPPVAIYVGGGETSSSSTDAGTPGGTATVTTAATTTEAATTTATAHESATGHESGTAQESSTAGGSATAGKVDRDGDDGSVVGVGEPGPTAAPHLASLPRPGRGWLVLAGIAFGAAVAVKWSGALALVAAGMLFLGWELARRRRVLGHMGRQPWSWIGVGLGALVILPIAVYAVTWIPWFVAFEETYMASGPCANEDNDLDCDGPAGRVGALVDYHLRMFEFHIDLDADHAYRAPATGWPIQHRPVVYFYDTCSDDRLQRVPQTDSDGEVTVPEPCAVPQGSAAEIMSLGNPAVWWLVIASLPLLGAALRRRSRGSWLVVAFIVVQFVPWLGPSRPVFNFYTVPIVPFLAMALAIAVDEVTSWRDAWRPWVVGVATSLALAGVLGLVATTTSLQVGWTLGWYLLGIAALVGGFIMGTDTSRAPAVTPATPGATEVGDTSRVWPLVVTAVGVVGMAIYFMPLWWGLTVPTWFVRAHYWFPTWI